MKRLSMVFRAKASKALDRAEDPRETLDYSYERQLEMLRDVQRGVADVATSRKRVELQARQLQQKAAKLQDQARQAIEAGRDDLAREALSRRAAIVPQLEGLRTQHEQLQAEEIKLTQAAQRLQAKVDAFRTRKETIKATYTAAEAQTKIGEAVSGISEEMGDVGLAMQRAEDKTLQMQSRAGAIDELLASGALDDLSASSDPIQAELDRVAAGSAVDVELSRLKGELGSGTQPASLEAPEQKGER
ncbi:MAG: PspA/IM30 family protein [Actinomycetota bacterium]|nr:PspA/IM30 family protein [Actinomycetota bacterium]